MHKHYATIWHFLRYGFISFGTILKFILIAYGHVKDR